MSLNYLKILIFIYIKRVTMYAHVPLCTHVTVTCVGITPSKQVTNLYKYRHQSNCKHNNMTYQRRKQIVS